MRDLKHVRNVFLLSFVIAILFPLINIYIIYPSFARLIVKNIEIEAERASTYLLQELLPGDIAMNHDLVTVDFQKKVQRLQKDFKFIKLKIFSKTGAIYYSTDPDEVGSLNKKDYFHNIVVRGERYTKTVKKNGKSAEGRVYSIDVVETYVPIMRNGVFKGAFEIYYDITANNQNLTATLFRSSIIVLSLMFIAIVTMIIFLVSADKKNLDMQESESSSIYFSPYYSLLILAITVFGSEALVMIFIGKYLHISPLAATLFDSSVLVTLTSPTIYFLLLRPLVGQIKKRKDAEEALTAEKERLHMTLQSIGDGVISTDVEGKVILVNKVAEELTGWTLEEALGRPLTEVFSLINGKTKEPYKKLLNRALKAGKAVGLFQNSAIVSKDGREHFISASTAPIYDQKRNLIGVIIVFRDLTRRIEGEREKSRLETQLLHAQKLEAIGILAAGIAHEINTPIQFIGDNTHFLQDSFKDIIEIIEKFRAFHQAAEEDRRAGKLAEELAVAEERADIEYLTEEIPKSIKQILDGVERVSTIVKSMKAFSHPDTKKMIHADLNKAIQDTLTISRNEYKYVAEVETSFDNNLPLVPCYLGELNQVFLNLIVNAAHAINDANGNGNDSGEPGLITIRTRKEANEVVVEFSDTGTGIPEDVAPHIFEHFFTTKDVNKGSGQGLSISHSVITRKHHGTISFETEVGRGTTFFIRLPLEVQQSVNA